MVLLPTENEVQRIVTRVSLHKRYPASENQGKVGVEET